jgi:hypothetical protein
MSGKAMTRREQRASKAKRIVENRIRQAEINRDKRIAKAEYDIQIASQPRAKSYFYSRLERRI